MNPPPMSQPSNRIAVIVAPLTHDRDYSALDLGTPVPGAPMCVTCHAPASLVLDAGPACRTCLNASINDRLHPKSARSHA